MSSHDRYASAGVHQVDGGICLSEIRSGAEIEIEYEDLLAVKRSGEYLPARIELIVTDAEAALLIDQLIDTNYRVLH